MVFISDMDHGSLLTVAFFFAIAIGVPILIVRIFVRAQREAAKQGVHDAFNIIKGSRQERTQR